MRLLGGGRQTAAERSGHLVAARAQMEVLRTRPPLRAHEPSPPYWLVTYPQFEEMRQKMVRANEEMSYWFEDKETYHFIMEGFIWLEQGAVIVQE